MIYPILCKVLNLLVNMNPKEFFKITCSQAAIIILIDP